MFALLGGPARPDLECFGCHALGQEIILAAGAAGICLAGAAPYEPHRKYSIFAWRPSGFNCGKRPDKPAVGVANPRFPPIRISADHTPCAVDARGVGSEMDQDGSSKAPARGPSMNSPTVAVSSIAAAATAMTELEDDGATGIVDLCNDICKCRANGGHMAAVASSATPDAALLHVEGMAYVPFIRRASLFTKIRGYRPTQITPGFEQRLAFLVEALGAGIGDEGNDNDRGGGLRRLGAVYVRSGCVELIMEEEEWGDDESLENERDAEEVELQLGTVEGYHSTSCTAGYDTRTEPSSPPSLPQPSPQELPLQPRSAGLQTTRAVTRDEGPAAAAAMTANVEAAATSNMGPVGNDGIAADFKPFPHFLDMETGLPSAPVASGAVSGFRSRDGRSSGSTSLSSMELTAIIQALQLQDEEGAVSEERWKEKAEEDEEGSQEAAEEEAFAAEALSVVAGGGRVVAVTAAVESLCDGTAEVAVCGGQGFRESVAPSTSNCNWSTEPHAPAAPFLLGPVGEQRYGIRVDAVQPRMLLLWAPPPLLATSEGVGPATATAASASGRVAAVMQAPVPSPQLAPEERRHQALRLDTAQRNAAAAATTAAAAAEIHLQLQQRHLSERRQGWLRGQLQLQLQPQLQPLPIPIPEHQAREHLEDSVTTWDVPRGRSQIPAHIEAQDSGPLRPPNVGAVPNPYGGREGTSTALAAAAVLHVAVRCPAVMTAEEGPGGLEVLFRSQGKYLPLRARWLVGSGGGGVGGTTLQSEAADATTTTTNGESTSHGSLGRLGRHSESSVTFGLDSVLQNSEPVTSFAAAAARAGAAVVIDGGVVAAAAAAAAEREGGGDSGTAGRGDGRGAVPGPVPDVMVGADVDQLQILVLEVLELPRRPGIALVDFRWRGRPCRAVPLVLTTDPAVAAELQAAVAAWSRPQVELDELLLDYGTWEFHVSSAVPASCTTAALPASTSISSLDATAALVRGGEGSCNLSNRMRSAPDGAELAMQISTRRLVQLSVHLLAYASASGWVCTAAYIQVQLHNLNTTCGAARTGVVTKAVEMKAASCHGHGGTAVVAEMQVMDRTVVPEPQLQAMETEAEMGADACRAVELHHTWLQSTAATAAAAQSVAVDKANGHCRCCSKAACALCVGDSSGIVHGHGSVSGQRVPWASAVILPALGLSRITPAETSVFHQYAQPCIHALSTFLLAFDVGSLITLFLCERYELLTSITTTILVTCIVSLFVVLVCLVLPHATWRRLLLTSRYCLIVDYVVTKGLAGLAGLTPALGMMTSPWSCLLRPTLCLVLPAAFMLASRGATVSLTLAAGMSYTLLIVKALASFPALAAAQGLTTAGLGLATTAVCQAYLRYSFWKQQQHQPWHPSEPS